MAKKDLFGNLRLNIPGVDKFLPAAAWIILTIIFFTLLIPLAWYSTVSFFTEIFTSAPVVYVGEGVSTTVGAGLDGLGEASDAVVETVSGWMPGEEEAVIDGTTGAETSIEELPPIE